MFNRDKIIDWLNLSIEVAHEIQGQPWSCCTSELTMPEDIALALLAIDILDRENGEYKFYSKEGVVYVRTSRAAKLKMNLKIEVYKY